MILARVTTATTGLVSALKIVRREEESDQGPAPVASVSAASVREIFLLNFTYLERNGKWHLMNKIYWIKEEENGFVVILFLGLS